MINVLVFERSIAMLTTNPKFRVYIKEVRNRILAMSGARVFRLL